MPRNSASVHGLDEVRELNRVFLNYLRRRLEAGRRMRGLPPPAARALVCASAATIERLADLPQAMFRFDLDGLTLATIRDPASAGLDADQRMLNEFLLVSAWNISRQSSYAARLFLRMSDNDVGKLRAIPLADLAVLSLNDDLVRCAYREVSWLWQELVTVNRPEHRRRLMLLAMQPGFELNRPVPLIV